MGQEIRQPFLELRQASELGQLVVVKKLRQKRPPVHQLEGPAQGQLEGAGIDEIAARHRIVRGQAGVQVEIDRGGVEDFDRFLGVHPPAAEAHPGRQVGVPLPFAAENPQIHAREFPKSQPAVGIARPHERDFGPVSPPLHRRQREGTVHGRIGGQRQVEHVFLTDGGQFFKKRLLLDHGEQIVERGEGLPIGKKPVVLHKPHGRGHAVAPQTLEHLTGKRGLGQGQHQIRAKGLHLGGHGLRHRLEKTVFQIFQPVGRHPQGL